MSFEVRKQHKLQDQIEHWAYEWALEDVFEYYNVKEPSELTKEQVDEISHTQRVMIAMRVMLA